MDLADEFGELFCMVHGHPKIRSPSPARVGTIAAGLLRVASHKHGFRDHGHRTTVHDVRVAVVRERIGVFAQADPRRRSRELENFSTGSGMMSFASVSLKRATDGDATYAITRDPDRPWSRASACQRVYHTLRLVSASNAACISASPRFFMPRSSD